MSKVIIGPVEAQDLLVHNDHNRKLSKARIKKYAEEMRNGMWIYNGEAIIVSTSGRLLDGQHRLYAIIEANAEIEVQLIQDVPDQDEGVDTFLTINTENRSNSDALYIAGFEIKTPQVANLLSFREAYEAGKLAQKPSGFKLLNHEVVELAREFGEKNLLRIISRGETLHARCPMLHKNHWTILVYAFGQLQEGNRFLEMLAECDDSQFAHPVSALTRYLKKIKAQKLGGAEVNKTRWIATFKAYDAFIKDHPIKNLRVSKAEPIIYPKDYLN